VFPGVRMTNVGWSLVPDISVIRWDRIPATADGEIADDFLELPDVAVEIVSPGQTVTNLRERCRWFVQRGVRIALLVVPTRRVVHRFDEHGRETELTGEDRIDLDDVLPGFELTVNELFAALRVE
jgi:Uma2 family endonuclease